MYRSLLTRTIVATAKSFSRTEDILICLGCSPAFRVRFLSDGPQEQHAIEPKSRNTFGQISIDREKLLKNRQSERNSLYPLKRLTKSSQIFEAVAVNSPNAEGFVEAIETFKKGDVKRLRVLNFISTAITCMEQFGVSKDVKMYNHLLDLFPKGVYHNRTVFDTLWTRFRSQIDCAVQILTKLEENGVRPNVETYDITHAVFGDDSIPLNKLRRIVFWFDKFDEMYPHPLPKKLPVEKETLHGLAIKQMFGNNQTFAASSYKDSGDVLLVVGAEKRNLFQDLENYDVTKPVFVEGPFAVWLRKTRVFYFALKVDVNPNIRDEESVLAVCILDDNEGETELKFWIKELQRKFPRLAELNVIFNISNHYQSVVV